MSKARFNNLSDFLNTITIPVHEIEEAVALADTNSIRITDLENATDPFPQYYNQTRGDNRYVRITTLAQPNGVATLDSSGKITFDQIPDAALGGLSYKGSWNVNTNTPELQSGVGVRGEFYKVSVEGNISLDGITDWKVGDWAIFDGSAWQKIDQTEVVQSVNNKTGSVTLNTDDISEGNNNLYYTDTRASNAAPIQTVHGRTGDVVGESGDYLAFEIDYDNTDSGLLATDTQNAIDEVNQNFINLINSPDPFTQYTTNSEASNAAPIQTVQNRTGDVVITKTDLNLDNVQNVDQTNASNLSSGLIPSARFNDGSHGSRSGGNLHANATTTVAGFMSAADKTKVDSIQANAEENTVDSVNNQTGAVTLDTDDINEGSTNLYYTNARASAAAPVQSVNGQTGSVNLTFDNYQGWRLQTDGTPRGSIVSNEVVNFVGGTNVNLNYSATNNTITISSIDTNTDTNYYLNGLSFNPVNGILTATVNGTTNQTVDLDGRYLLEGGVAADSDKLDGQHGSYYQNASNLNAGTLPAARFNDTSHGNRSGGGLHAAVTTTTNGFMLATDKTKLNGIESGATADQTKADIDALNVDADTLDGLHAASFVRSDVSDTITAPYLDFTTTELRYQEDHFINKRFEIADVSNNTLYILLCANTSNNDVNGRITMDRTSGLRHACQVDIVVSAGTATNPLGSVVSHGLSGSSSPSYRLVTCTYNTNSYVALEITNPDNYYETSGAYFTGRIVDTSGNAFSSYVPADVSSVSLLASDNSHQVNGNRVLTTADEGSGSGLDADTVDGQHASAFASASHSHPYMPLSGGQMTGTLRVEENSWSSTSLTGNAICTNPSGANGFAFGNGTSVSTWFTYDGTLRRAINARNNGSAVEITPELKVANGIEVGGSSNHSYNGVIANAGSGNGHLMLDSNGGNLYLNWHDTSGEIRLQGAHIDCNSQLRVNGGVTGLSKSDVGLGSVDNYSRTHYDGRYVKLEQRNDGYVWVRRSTSGGSSLYVTQQSSANITEFRQGSGDGTEVSRVENDGTYYTTGGVTVDDAPVTHQSGTEGCRVEYNATSKSLEYNFF